jgi:acylphosphatase
MKQQDAEKIVSEVQQFSSRATAEIDTTYVRNDDNGYQVRVSFAGRAAKVRTLAQWAALKQAWHALNERR